ncbi:MAG: SipW-dependent-type signal peptide-containing protein [Oscillospiraceae bacterium]|nr:MAG: SipW-dependent-type signal peptide-containing protein [Oscillospiraceae bacterium]
MDCYDANAGNPCLHIAIENIKLGGKTAMTNSKSTKRALIFSTLAILMCAAMLIGTTFAWFTDTASTAVNKIQAGNLNVELEYSKDFIEWKGKRHN